MERAELERLLRKTDFFIGEIFDHVSELGQVGFLHQVQEFRGVVESKLKESV